MLRPELLEIVHNRLGICFSSDALTKWQEFDPNSKEMDRDIYNATEILREQIDVFAKELVDCNQDELFVDNSFASIKQTTFNGVPIKDALIREMHRRGINIRYLGLLALKTENLENVSIKMKNFFITIMVARTLKNMWREEIRTNNKGVKKEKRIHELCLETTETFLNRILTIPDQNFWNEVINKIKHIFGIGLMKKPLQKRSYQTYRIKKTIFEREYLLDNCSILPNVWHCAQSNKFTISQ